MNKLYKCYNLHSSAAKVLKMFELLSVRLKNQNSETRKHIDHIQACIEKLWNKGGIIEYWLAIGILNLSFKLQHLVLVAPDFKTLMEDQATCETVSERLTFEGRKT